MRTGLTPGDQDLRNPDGAKILSATRPQPASHEPCCPLPIGQPLPGTEPRGEATGSRMTSYRHPSQAQTQLMARVGTKLF